MMKQIWVELKIVNLRSRSCVCILLREMTALITRRLGINVFDAVSFKTENIQFIN